METRRIKPRRKLRGVVYDNFVIVEPGQIVPPCPHLGPQVTRKSDGEPLTIEVTCDTCGGKRKQVAQPLHECALFRRCLPTYRPSDEQRQEYEQRPDAVRLCDGCPRQLS